jgi:UDP-glucose 4-epimerase
MKILITGGSGFIGRNIAEYFRGRAEVLAPSHTELDLADDSAVRSYLEKAAAEVVIHGAIRPGHRNAQDPSQQFYLNTKMFFSLARNAHLFGKMLFLGSGAVYDHRHYQPKMKEKYFDAYVPQDELGFSKYVAAKYIERAKNIVELRLFGVFGKYEDYAIRFISNLICKAIFDLPLTLKQDRRFDYLFIDDLMPVLDYFIKHKGKHRAYNVTSGSPVNLLALAEKIKKIAGKDLPIKVMESGIGTEYTGDNGRLKREIRDVQFTPIDEAIQGLYQWYAENKEFINRDRLLIDK